MHVRTSVRTYVCIYGPMYGSMYVHKVIWDISHQLPELINLFSILAATFPSPLIVPYPPWQYDYTWYPAFFYIHSLEPTYPTWGIGKSSSKVPWRGDTLVSRRASSLTYPLNQKYQQKSPKADTGRHPNLRNATTSSCQWRLKVIAMVVHARHWILNEQSMSGMGWLVLTKERKGI